MMSSLRDIEQQNKDLESVVFDLKMRLYYLTNKLKSNNITVSEDEQASLDDRFNTRLREHDFMTVRLKEENEELRRHQGELETELLQLKSLVSSSSFLKNGGTSGMPGAAHSLVQLEENRRTERQAASALSQHDAAMIASLQEEAANVERKRQEDTALVGDLAYRIELLQTEAREREFVIAGQADRLQEVLAQTNALRDQLRRQDNLLEGRLFKFDPLGEAIEEIAEDTGGVVLEEGGNASLQYRPKYEDEAEEGAYSRTFTDFIQYKKFMYELNALKNENGLLRTQLERERRTLRRQEEHLYALNQSTAELTLLESTEVRRLTDELEKLRKLKFALEKRCYDAEVGASRLRREVDELGRLKEEMDTRDR
jgi:hypothetical protein